MNTLKAEARSMEIKAKKLRREGYITGNLFGRKIEKSIPVQMQKKNVEQLLKNNRKGSQITLDLEGKSYNVLIKDVEYNPMAGRIDEIDFQALVSDEKVRSVAEVVLLNHDKVADGVVEENLEEISYSALPAALIDKVEIDLSQYRIGDVVKVADLPIAKNKEIDLHTDLDAVVVSINEAHMQEETEDEEAETVAEE